MVKGTLVDVPLAFAEGLRNTPVLYGENIRDHGPVTDWKSGGIVAAKVSLMISTSERRDAFLFSYHATSSPAHRTLATVSTKDLPAWSPSRWKATERKVPLEY